MKLYRHYNGNIYNVITFNARDDQGRITVIYEPTYQNTDIPMFTQPYTRFFEKVNHDGEMVDRFTAIDLAEIATACAQ